ncbi:hypothetical protein K2173_024887 [Erythroxylum novogranatense]|uniref:Uncharacterized protein n=1 Tax=Erythroxylum novogranatense TaxID=1862640 RepID=A0AAV8UG78_9ROSI|nr:hypothetical protein K2173_024887 [Erythroxylum novogranatense]
MQSPSVHLCKTFTTNLKFGVFKSNSTSKHLSLSSKLSRLTPKRFTARCHNKPQQQDGVKVKGKKDNVWSVDNDEAKANAQRERERERERGKRRKKGGRRAVRGNRNKGGRIMVSGAMLMEVETVLQTQEPVIKPVWNTFASSVSGIWKGVGAVFSPITAEMEPIEIGKKDENLYDCYTLSRVESVPSQSGGTSRIKRKINWVTLNPYGEVPLKVAGNNRSKEKKDVAVSGIHVMPDFGSFKLEASDLMEEDLMGNETGLVFFEDGSYSRGPVDIPVGEADDTKYYLSPTYKFEQCLVKGCHKRLRIVHTIEFNNGGSEIQIMRVAVYEEEWASPVNIQDYSDMEFNLKPFSQRKRTQPSELIGSWKVFEVSATPVSIVGEEMVAEDGNGVAFVYLCTETLKKRSLPESTVYFGEEEMLDMQDVTVLWLPGGVTAYVDVDKDGVLCIGVGWYSDEGINLVMERDYGVDGKLREVRWKTEVKRRWSDPLTV